MATTPSISGREPSSKIKEDTQFSVVYVFYLDNVKGLGLIGMLDINLVSCLYYGVEWLVEVLISKLFYLSKLS